MPRLRPLLFTAITLLLYAGPAAAAEVRAASVVSGVERESAAPALFQLLVRVPAGAAAYVPPARAEAGARAVPGKKAIPPGRALVPVVYDRVRSDAILKLVRDIYYNEPLPYSQDGTVFSNREGRLPERPQGYYKEYTLLTGSAPHFVKIGTTTYTVAPDQSARGSERCIVGGGETLYYTPDHYQNFIHLKVLE